MAEVDQNTEYTGVNINNAIPRNPPEPTDTIIPYGDTPDDKNEDDAKGLAGVEECENQPKMPGVKTIYHQEETPGVTTPEEEEEIMEI